MPPVFEISPETLADLNREGEEFIARYGTPVEGDETQQEFADEYNKSTGACWPQLSLPEFMRVFAVMHGYLQDAYISGYWQPGMPEWAKTRQTSWKRWILYLKAVRGLTREGDAQSFACVVFRSVDHVEAYT